ncbi:4-coumarate--CoA ligase [Aplysia californica]|uniref:4-coumarate--CoA ligase n=1 Tax=Aplysia californica TaxID=6500 RepID=A0ABM0K9C1_APLCA|nr:4-coumarate--CoA ligase [Aplysia californica]
MLANSVRQLCLRSASSHSAVNILMKCPRMGVILQQRIHAALGFESRSFSASACVWRQVMSSQYIFKSPIEEIDIPTNVTLHGYFFKVCDEYKDSPAMTDVPTGKTYTYTQLKENIIKVASGLHRAGFRKGDVILVFSTNQIDFTVLQLASSCLGLWFSPANPQYTPMELNRQMNHSGAISIFALDSLAGVVDQALDCKDLPHNIKSKYVFGDVPGYTPFSSLLEDDGSVYPEVSIDPLNDVFTLPYSSGTTGLPKGVMLTNHNCFANVLQSGAGLPITPNDRALGLLPLYHIYGMVVVQFGVLSGGGHLFYVPKFEAHSCLKCIQDNKINLAHLVPPLVVFLAKNPVVSEYDVSSLQRIYSGAAPLGQDVSFACLKRHPDLQSLNQVYGLTETSPLVTIDSKELPGSIGQLTVNTLGKVADVNSFEALPPGQVGELCVKGPQVMKGYFNNQKATDEMIDSDGWLHTGDIVYAEESGAFYAKDRIKELIKYKGSQVAPAELEDLLQGHSDVQDAAVIGVADEMAGELPKAFIVKKSGSNVTEEEIKKFVEERVAHTKKLRGGVQFVDNIPKNPSGKILRRVLKTTYL